MQRYILNSAVITSPGSYHYELTDVAGAVEWVNAGPFVSTIGYPETAAALGELVMHDIPVNRRVVTMDVGDAALVFRLVLPPGEMRITPADKGTLGADYIRRYCEIGILRRVADACKPAACVHELLTLPRTGNAPLAFRGELVAEAGTRVMSGREQNRWHVLELYRTEHGQWVIHVSFGSQWEGELSRSDVAVLENDAEVIGYLAAYEPLPRGAGYPPGAQFVEKQARMVASLRGNYEAAVSELLEGAGIREVLE